MAMAPVLDGRSKETPGRKQADKGPRRHHEAVSLREQSVEIRPNSSMADDEFQMRMPHEHPSHCAPATLLIKIAVLSMVLFGAEVQEALGKPLQWSELKDKKELRSLAASGIALGATHIYADDFYEIDPEETISPIAVHIVANLPRNTIQSFEAKYKRVSNGDIVSVKGVTLICFALKSEGPDPAFLYRNLPWMEDSRVSLNRTANGNVEIGSAGNNENGSNWCLPLEYIDESNETRRGADRSYAYKSSPSDTRLIPFFHQVPGFGDETLFIAEKTEGSKDAGATEEAEDSTGRCFLFSGEGKRGDQSTRVIGGSGGSGKDARLRSTVMHGEDRKIEITQDLLLRVDGVHFLNSTESPRNLSVTELLSKPGSAVDDESRTFDLAAEWDDVQAGNFASFHCWSRIEYTMPNDLKGTTDVLGGRYHKERFDVHTAIGIPSTVTQVLDRKMVGDSDAVCIYNNIVMDANRFLFFSNPEDGFTVGAKKKTEQAAAGAAVAKRSLLQVELKLQGIADSSEMVHKEELRNTEYQCVQNTILPMMANKRQQKRIEKAISNSEAIGERSRPDPETILNAFVALMAAVVAAITTGDTVEKPLTYMSRKWRKFRKVAAILWHCRSKWGANSLRGGNSQPSEAAVLGQSRRDLISVPSGSSDELDPSKEYPALDRAVTILLLALLMASFGAPNIVYLVEEVRLHRWKDITGFINKVGAESTLKVSEGFGNGNEVVEYTLDLALFEVGTVTRVATETNIPWMSVFVIVYLTIVAALLAKRFEQAILACSSLVSTKSPQGDLQYFQNLPPDEVSRLVAASDEDGRSLLHAAVSAGRLGMVQELVARGARESVNRQDDEGWAPLHTAVSINNVPLVEYLLEMGATVDVKNAGKREPIHYAASKGGRELVDVLLANGATVNVQDATGSTPLHRAASAGRLKAAQALVEKGALIDARDRTGATPLFVAVTCQNDSIALYLAAQGADLEAETKDKQTPLGSAGKLAQVLRAAANGDIDVDDL
eukprot:evm.model.scf_170.3 EVM.evm.TU.scf_170.3   scf_170:59658-67574(-)